MVLFHKFGMGKDGRLPYDLFVHILLARARRLRRKHPPSAPVERMEPRARVKV